MGKWEEKRIGDIAFTKSGGTPKRGFKAYWEKGNIPWLKSGELNDNKYITENSEFITQEAIENSAAKLFPKGSLLIAMYGATAGKLGILAKDAATNQAVCSIQNKKGLFDEAFLFNYLLLIREDIIRDSFGGAQPNISKSYIDNIKIPLPPLAEQQRIVAKLDGLFAKIDQAMGLLEANIAHTQALMGSVLDEIYSNGETMLKEVCILGPKKSEVRDLDDDLEVSFLPMRDLNEHDINFSPNEIKKINEVYKGYTYFADEDIILAKVTPCFENGKAGLAKNLTNGIGFGSSEYHVLRPKENVLPEWIYFSVLTEQFRVTGKENMTGAGGLKRIPRPFLEEWKIPVPELSIQKKQIKRIVQIQEETKNLESSVHQKLNHLKALKSSLLDQAFKGELLKDEVIELTKDKKASEIADLFETLNFDYEVAVVVLLTSQILKRNYGKKYIHKMFSNINFLEAIPVFEKLKFKEHYWGMHCPILEKTIKNKKFIYFDEVAEDREVLNFNFKHIKQVSDWMQKDDYTKGFVKLVKDMISVYEKSLIAKEMDRIELLNTVLQCIHVLNTYNFESIRTKMASWKMNEGNYKTKTDKFKPLETELMIELIKGIKR